MANAVPQEAASKRIWKNRVRFIGDQGGNGTQHITDECEFNGNQEASPSGNRGEQTSPRYIGNA
jgi:hypothetical protein